nr:hypothetical protein [Morchella crassipes]
MLCLEICCLPLLDMHEGGWWLNPVHHSETACAECVLGSHAILLSVTNDIGRPRLKTRDLKACDWVSTEDLGGLGLLRTETWCWVCRRLVSAWNLVLIRPFEEHRGCIGFYVIITYRNFQCHFVPHLLEGLLPKWVLQPLLDLVGKEESGLTYFAALAPLESRKGCLMPHI